jgi:hypothetical protein
MTQKIQLRLGNNGRDGGNGQLRCQLGIITHTLIAIALPPKARRIWQGLFIIGEIGAIGNNASTGVKLDF